MTTTPIPPTPPGLPPISETIRKHLEAMPLIPKPMPHCADMLLSLVGLNLSDPEKNGIKPDSLRMFEGYFRFAHAPVFPPGKFNFQQLPNELHPDLFGCLNPDHNPQVILKTKGEGVAAASTGGYGSCFPSTGCRPNPCLSLAGDRHGGERHGLRRLLIADAVWLFYMERMGTFQILGALLDDYATQGKLPISTNTLAAFVMEEMIDSIKQGTSSTQQARAVACRRALGWTTQGWRERNYESAVNNSFSQLLHKLITSVLGFYRDKRLAVAIQGLGAGTPSMATITEIGETIKLLKLAFAPFEYGRVYSDLLSGIIWTIATHALVDELRDDIGIPRDFKRPDQYIPAAFDLLVAKQPVTNSDVNRYTVHRTLADQGRRIVLDAQGLPPDSSPTQLEAWLNDKETEASFEAYRAAYRNVTGADLGAAPAGAPIIIEQAA